MNRDEVSIYLQSFDPADRQKSRQIPEVVAQLREEVRLCYELMSVQNKPRLDGLVNAIDESSKLFNRLARNPR